MKKSTGWILFGVAAGLTAAGAYYVMKNKEKFIKEEQITNPDGTTQMKRTYVALDMDNAKNKVSETFNKTVETAKETWKKVENKIEEVKNNKDEAEEVETVETVTTEETPIASEEVPASSEEISDFSAEEEV